LLTAGIKPTGSELYRLLRRLAIRKMLKIAIPRALQRIFPLAALPKTA
jgi:hypothetical protein